MKIATQASTATTMVPEFYLNGETQDDQYGILRLDRAISHMWDRVTEESLCRLQNSITLGKSFLNKKGVTNAVIYKTAPDGDTFKLGYVSNPHADLEMFFSTGVVVSNDKAKAVKEITTEMFSDF